MANGLCEGIWIRRLLQELGVELDQPMRLLCDNQSALFIAKNLVHHDTTKHVEIDHHSIKEKVENNVVQLKSKIMLFS